MSGLDDIDFDTVSLIRPECTNHDGLATYLAFVECVHGFYTYSPYCEKCWMGLKGWLSRPNDTVTATFTGHDHSCAETTWDTRYFVPAERRYLASS